ncbi:unnamed protein product [Hymenolepis diminuta]|uniref:Uncharacterized protein n=1 Tax=Hymenolepis diminuta TaxID=6216 RepID=A0A564Z866_HYMDI|nr:unnamed protein product [Hymenolepis diminuta]
MIIAEASLTRRCFGTSPVNTVSSLSYNRPVQSKHTYSYVLTHVLIQVMNKNSLSIHTYIYIYRLSLVRHILLPSLP